MAQVRFYAAKFKFAKIRQLVADFPNEADFKFLIFQSVNEDSNNNRDVFNLVAYRVGSDLSVKELISSSDLIPDSDSDPYRHSGKLILANYPLSKETIVDYVNMPGSGLIDHLYFEAEAFPRQRKYVHYKISVAYTGEVLKSIGGLNSDGELNPSPPADPS